MCEPCRRAFEPFGSLKPIISAIGDKKRADSVLEVRCCHAE